MAERAPERAGYRRLNHGTEHEHFIDGKPAAHDHRAGGTRHWHSGGSDAAEFGLEPVTGGAPLGAGRMLLEVRRCGACGKPVIYWDGDFRHLTPNC